jgi:TonB family protein
MGMAARVAGAVLLACSASAVFADPAADAGAAAPHVIQNAYWIRRPTGQDLVAFYPRQALERGVNGRAVVRCRVRTDGALTDCEVTAETPLGWGFGVATVAVAEKVFKMRPQTLDGQRVADGSVFIPLSWHVRGLGRGDINSAETGYVLTVAPEAGHAKGTTVGCPIATDAKRRCLAHETDWVFSPSAPVLAAALHADPKASGVSQMLCTVGKHGLDGCAPLAKATPAQAAAMLALAPHLQPSYRTRDGVDTFGAPMLVEFDWLEAYNELR